MSGDTGPNFVCLASNRLFWRVGDPYVYPYAVDIDFRETPPAIWVSEGVTFSAVGAKLTVAEALAPAWELHFGNAEAEWLRPYLTRMSQGETVAEEELVTHFLHLHGRDPETIA